MNAKKMATSLPASQFEALERTRRRLHLKRSEAVQEALALWISTCEGDERTRQYLRGYVDKPEDAKEGRAFVRAWARGLGAEDW